MGSIEVAGHSIGLGDPCFIIAEAGVNHNGSLEMARQLIDAAAEVGADAIKFQTFQAERLAAPGAPKASYQMRTTDHNESQFDLLRRLELAPNAHQDLIAYAQEKRLVFLSSPFDEESADLLVGLGLPALKIPSGEITNLPFLAHVAHQGKPMIVSTGMSRLGEVEKALETIEAAGSPDVILLHCVSNYPADPADVNLRAMQTMATAFRKPVGYSDHTFGVEAALGAVALGACVIEKHVTLDRGLPGPDHLASSEPHELAALIRSIRTLEAALGDGRKGPAKSEANTASVARKSLVAARDIGAGELLTDELIAVKRPGTGLQPALGPYLVGRVARVGIPAGSVIALEMLA